MSKLFKLKEWLTLEEAAKHLSSVLGEEVQVKDILQLALDKHLKLSAYLVNSAVVKLGEIVGCDQIKVIEVPLILLKRKNTTNEPEEKRYVTTSICIDDNHFINLDEHVSYADGVWDLMMIGGERLEIEHMYQMLIGGVEVTSSSIDGGFIQQGNKVAQLQESFDNNEFRAGTLAQKHRMERFIKDLDIPPKKADKLRAEYEKDRKANLNSRSENFKNDYFPCSWLPDDSLLVVRSTSIVDFLNSLESDQPKNTSSSQSKEKNTLLVMIAALCNELEIKPNQRGVSASLEMMTENIGAPLSDDTIRKILRQLEDAVTARSK